MTQMPCSAAQRPMASTWSGGYTAPLGLDGDTKMSAFVRGVRAASSWSTVTLNPVVTSVWSTTGTPPASRIGSGYVVQYGAGSSTSSPSSTMVRIELYTACLPPLVTSTWPAVTS